MVFLQRSATNDRVALQSVEGILALSIPILAIIGGIGAGVAHMVFEHQQKLAEINAMSGANGHEVKALREEVSSLRQLVTEQAIAVDDLRRTQDLLLKDGTGQELRTRMG
jgi:hypothetical protein